MHLAGININGLANAVVRELLNHREFYAASAILRKY